LLASAIAVALVGSTLAVFSLGVDARNEKKVGGGGHGLGTYRTTGDVLDPIGADGRASAAEIDPAKYLRDFSYGRALVLDDGTTLREYTIIADDRQTVELPPGVYYNAWTFNGSIQTSTTGYCLWL
jgi:manganese oxidase